MPAASPKDINGNAGRNRTHQKLLAQIINIAVANIIKKAFKRHSTKKDAIKERCNSRSLQKTA
jgi:hypothetical protein